MLTARLLRWTAAAQTDRPAVIERQSAREHCRGTESEVTIEGGDTPSNLRLGTNDPSEVAVTWRWRRINLCASRPPAAGRASAIGWRKMATQDGAAILPQHDASTLWDVEMYNVP